MDTDDLELDDDFLLPHQAVQYATAAAVPQQTVAEPAPRTRADTTLNSVKGIPGPAGDRDGLSARPQVVHQSRGQPVPRGTHSELGCIGNSAVLGPCVVSLDELVPFMAGGGFSVLLKVCKTNGDQVNSMRDPAATSTRNLQSMLTPTLLCAGSNRQITRINDLAVFSSPSTIAAWLIHAAVECISTPCIRGTELCLYCTREHCQDVREPGRRHMPCRCCCTLAISCATHRTESGHL